MAVKIAYAGETHVMGEGESVLSCLLRKGVEVSHSCQSGVCQSCLLLAEDGEVPSLAQEGLKPSYKKRGLFLACQCIPEQDMRVCAPDGAGLDVKARIEELEYLNHNLMRVLLCPDEVFEAEPGQYLTLFNADQVGRSYSVANDPVADGSVELHVRLIVDGAMSGWLANEAQVGDLVTLRGPAGNCFYVREEGDDYPIVLAGTGTGLAPLYGIVCSALEKGHKGAIVLYHGALKVDDLYLVEALQALDAEYKNFVYRPCVLHGEEGAFYQVGHIEDLVMCAIPEDKSAARLFLCGAPEFVNSLKRKAFLAGLASPHIYTDAFLPSK